MPAKRDRSFLYMAAIAGSGGVLAIVVSIGLPLWMTLHGRPFMPAIALMAGWGVAALAGAYACLNTYFLSDTVPPRPPRGGLPVSVLPPPAIVVARDPRDAGRRAA